MTLKPPGQEDGWGLTGPPPLLYTALLLFISMGSGQLGGNPYLWGSTEGDLLSWWAGGSLTCPAQSDPSQPPCCFWHKCILGKQCNVLYLGTKSKIRHAAKGLTLKLASLINISKGETISELQNLIIKQWRNHVYYIWLNKKSWRVHKTLVYFGLLINHDNCVPLFC